MPIENNYLRLTIEERSKLKAEFDQLNTINQKYDFWKTNFDYDYSHYHKLDLISTADFKISPRNPVEIEELNKRFYTDNKIQRFVQHEQPEKWKESFLLKIASASNKKSIIEHELSKIDAYILKFSPSNNDDGFSGMKSGLLVGSDPFYKGYEEYLINRRELDLTKEVFSPFTLIALNAGMEWAKYREFVENHLKPEKKEPAIELTGEQKVLILHHLGFGEELNTYEERSILYEFFINELKSTSIKRLFPNIKDYETEKNLDTLIEFFRLIKLNSKARELEDKLTKLRQKPQRK